MTTETLHRIDITISQDRIDHRFTCAGTPLAACHLVCPEGCDSWQLDHVAEMRERLAGVPNADAEAQQHELVDGGECNLVTFIENDESYFYELYDGPTHTLISGQVELTYQDEYVTWSYVESDDSAVPLTGVSA